MDNKKEMSIRKHVALIAHDANKPDLLAWVKANQDTLAEHDLYATGATGKMISDETKLQIFEFKSGPLGGDIQIGAAIVDNQIDFLVFFWDPLAPQPHDPDIRALLRLAVLYNIPTASNRATADFLITSPFMKSTYVRELNEYDSRLQRIYSTEEGQL